MGSVSDTLRALSDDKSLAIFNMIAFNLSKDSGVIMNKLGITKKQYYSRMNQLINVGLVMRKSGMYFVTSLGKVVFESHVLIGQAIENYWKLKAIDSIELSIPDNNLPAEQRKKLIDTLIENSDIKNILLDQSTSDRRKQISAPLKVSNLNNTPVAR